MLWLPGAEVLPATQDGGPQDTSFPPRLVIHTTEGTGTVGDLAGYYHGSTFWPNLTADLVGRKIAQHIPFNRGGRALTHPDGTIPTNDANCIQIEIIGFAGQSALWPLPQIDWLAQTLAPMITTLGIHHTAPAFVPNGAGFNAPQRMTEAAWRAFCGICGHEHVPENDHWDPGAFQIERFLAALTPPEEDMPLSEAEWTRLGALVRSEVDASIQHQFGGYVNGVWVDAAALQQYRKDHNLSTSK